MTAFPTTYERPIHPSVSNAREAIDLEDEARDDERRWHESEVGRAYARVWRAMMLAPTIEICEALLRDEKVPIDRLRPEWVRRFGLR
jgi:hypothetical protein